MTKTNKDKCLQYCRNCLKESLIKELGHKQREDKRIQIFH